MRTTLKMLLILNCMLCGSMTNAEPICSSEYCHTRICRDSIFCDCFDHISITTSNCREWGIIPYDAYNTARENTWGDLDANYDEQ